jgi:hypothetical protein
VALDLLDGLTLHQLLLGASLGRLDRAPGIHLRDVALVLY